MASEPWNRVDIVFPGAVSVVKIPFSLSTEASVKALVVENKTVRKLIGSEILQTEIRVLYELLYIQNNSQRGNKTFRALKQVEQCINRLKCMKLDAALQELKEMCPNRIQRNLSMEAGECDIPSQPMLEWLCLKVLGGAQLMSCTLRRCKRAFSLYIQHLNLRHFIIRNMVIASMLSRLWVIARSILVSLSTLYQQLLELLREVASAHPMPFLTDFSLPADMAQFLGPTDADTLLQKTHKLKKFQKQVREAATFKDMATHLDEMIPWYKSQKMGRERRFLTFLRLKCQRLKCVEAEGYNVQRKLPTFRREVCWASSPQGPMPTSCRSSTATRSRAGLRTRLQSLRSRCKSSTVRNAAKKKQVERRRRREKKEKTHELKKFLKQVREAATFKDMVTHLDEMIPWYKSQKMGRERRVLTFLRLKCQRLKCVEAEGYSVQRKLPAFRRKVCWALSPQGPIPPKSLLGFISSRTNTTGKFAGLHLLMDQCQQAVGSSIATRRRAGLRTRLQSLRSRCKTSTVRNAAKKKQVERQRRREEKEKTHKLKKFLKQVRKAATFKDMATHLDEMIPWYKSQKMDRERRDLTFLRLKCQRLKCVEAEGYNVQRKLPAFRRKVCWALSPQGPIPPKSLLGFISSRTNTTGKFAGLHLLMEQCQQAVGSSIATRRRAGLRTCLQLLRSRCKTSTVRNAAKKKQVERRRRREKKEH